jgi:hypothetical protein
VGGGACASTEVKSGPLMPQRCWRRRWATGRRAIGVCEVMTYLFGMSVVAAAQSRQASTFRHSDRGRRPTLLSRDFTLFTC